MFCLFRVSTSEQPNRIAALMTPATNPYYSTSGLSTNTPPAIPCVGATGCAPSTKYVSTVAYDANGVITATATSSSGLNSETYTLSPVFSSGRVDWTVSGSCLRRAGGALC